MKRCIDFWLLLGAETKSPCKRLNHLHQHAQHKVIRLSNNWAQRSTSLLNTSERMLKPFARALERFSIELLHSVIGWNFSRHFFNQSEEKPKPIVARACTFPRPLCRLRVITSSFDWFTGLSSSFLIGQSNYFGFGFTTLNWKPL